MRTFPVLLPGVQRVRAAVAACVVTLTLAAAPSTTGAATYNPGGPYALSPAELATSPLLLSFVYDSRGVPQVVYPFGVYYNPAIVAQYGLSAASRYLASARGTHDPDLGKLLGMADWLVSNQDRRGRWLYRFNFTALGSGQVRAPWPSALAQGSAMSLLTRAYVLTGERRYVDASTRALPTFDRSSRRGGVRSNFAGTPWFEEYPSAQPTHVLNGFMVALIGLYDECTWSRHACGLFVAGMAALRARIRAFDRAGGTYYAANRTVASRAYHALHVTLLSALISIYPNAYVHAVRDRWAAE